MKNILMSGRGLLALCSLLALSAPAARADGDAALVDFFAGRGCAIGPDSRQAAIAAGFAADRIDALLATEAARDGAVASGEWLVMAPDTCRMRLPEIGGALQLGDPEVVAAISAVDAHVDIDSPGCFLDSALLEMLQQTRGWDADSAFREYMQLIARSVSRGEMTFYSDSGLVTPVGYQVTTGDCAKVPQIAEIRRDHDFLTANFDPIMRAILAKRTCDESWGLTAPDLNAMPGLASGTGTSNAWTWLEIETIAMAAGWIEGMDYSERGVPRPPICQYSLAPPPAMQVMPGDERAQNRKARRDAGGP